MGVFIVCTPLVAALSNGNFEEGCKIQCMMRTVKGAISVQGAVDAVESIFKETSEYQQGWRMVGIPVALPLDQAMLDEWAVYLGSEKPIELTKPATRPDYLRPVPDS